MKDSSGLVELVKTRDQEAISRLYDTYAPALNGVILRILKSPEKAEIVLEKTFLKIIENIHSYKNNVSLFTWMFCLARAVAMEALTLPEMINDKGEEIEIPEGLPMNHRDGAVIDGMPSLCRMVWEHMYCEGHNLSQTAAALGMSVNDVRVQFKAAFEHMYTKGNTKAS
jgi:RNA polymerase sigma factor (sigma-70 family)